MAAAEDPDLDWMQSALEEARRGLGCTSPNPPVGAVLVREGRLLATGFHRRAGLPHAEIEALQALPPGESARGATLYVTLEPCSSHGRTPPCTDAILKAGLRRVVYGSTDPDPRHAGRGETLLQAGGVEVRPGVLAAECDHLIRVFRHWARCRTPYVFAKAAISLDGRLTRPPGEGQWLTSEASRRHAQWLRQQADAILVGARTVQADDPALTLRLPELPDGKPQPWRIVLTRSGKVPLDSRIFRDAFAERTLVLQSPTADGLLLDLAERGIASVLVEGGGETLSWFLEHRLVHEIHLFVAPLLTGGPHRPGSAPGQTGPLISLRRPRFQPIGSDLLIEAFPEPAPDDDAS